LHITTGYNRAVAGKYVYSSVADYAGEKGILNNVIVIATIQSVYNVKFQHDTIKWI